MTKPKPKLEDCPICGGYNRTPEGDECGWCDGGKVEIGEAEVREVRDILKDPLPYHRYG